VGRRCVDEAEAPRIYAGGAGAAGAIDHFSSRYKEDGRGEGCARNRRGAEKVSILIPGAGIVIVSDGAVAPTARPVRGYVIATIADHSVVAKLVTGYD
jgi:hypothetical protein